MRALLALILLIGSISAAGASDGKMVDAYSGNPTYVYTIYWLGPNCQPLPFSRSHYSVPLAPAHGHLIWLSTMVATRYPATNPLHVCNNAAHPGYQLLYRSDAGYTGPDKFRVVVTFPAGGTLDISRPITVRSPK
jgi:hypothetical protein